MHPSRSVLECVPRQMSAAFPPLPLLLWMLTAVAFSQTLVAGPLEAVTFASEPGKLFVPVAEVVDELGWRAECDDMGKVMELNSLALRAGSLRSLVDGTELVSTELLAQAGAEVAPPDADGRVRVGGLFRGFTLVVSEQRVEIDLAKQRLQAWQGGRLVLQTRISSGRNGRTPVGEFRAGPYRAVKHYSSRYHNAPMPWSVQVNGHVFIHGFTSVPDYPASHGCIRLPLNEGNPAKFFYEWVQNGTPVRISR